MLYRAAPAAHYNSQWGYRVGFADDPAALKQPSESLFCVCFDLQLNYYTKATYYTQVTSTGVLVEGQNQFTAGLKFKVTSQICFIIVSFGPQVKNLFLIDVVQLPSRRLHNLYLHRSILVLRSVSGSGTSIAYSRFLNRISLVSTLDIDLSVNRTVEQRYSFP